MAGLLIIKDFTLLRQIAYEITLKTRFGQLENRYNLWGSLRV